MADKVRYGGLDVAGAYTLYKGACGPGYPRLRFDDFADLCGEEGVAWSPTPEAWDAFFTDLWAGRLTGGRPVRSDRAEDWVFPLVWGADPRD